MFIAEGPYQLALHRSAMCSSWRAKIGSGSYRNTQGISFAPGMALLRSAIWMAFCAINIALLRSEEMTFQEL